MFFILRSEGLTGDAGLELCGRSAQPFRPCFFSTLSVFTCRFLSFFFLVGCCCFVVVCCVRRHYVSHHFLYPAVPQPRPWADHACYRKKTTFHVGFLVFYESETPSKRQALCLPSSSKECLSPSNSTLAHSVSSSFFCTPPPYTSFLSTANDVLAAQRVTASRTHHHSMALIFCVLCFDDLCLG